MDGANKASLSEDEEDLEALRLAALQTLKKNATSSQALPNNCAVVGPRTEGEFSSYRSAKISHGKFSNKRGRFYGGRGSKNGQFTGRAVSSNLISLTPSTPREENKPKGIQDAPLFLPQDRYCNKKAPDSQESKADEGSSKFDRYKDSDKSDEEDSEDEALKSDSDDDSPAKLVKSDSLEALMQELDDEILGRSKAKEEKSVKVKTKVKRKKESSKTETEEELEENESKTEVLTEIVGEVIQKKEESPKEKKSSDISKPLSPKEVLEVKPLKQRPIEKEPQLKKRRHALPSPQRDVRGYRGKPPNIRRSPPLLHPLFLSGSGTLPFPPNNPPIFTTSNLIINPPPLYERPLSPLLINAETLQNQTMAPLSPRSAAFVLKNRAIIEKRKRSPRRSYSRSPSPRRRSLSPRRSLTPPRRRSMTPRKRSLSPRKRSLSPRKRSLSPTRKRSRSPKRRSVSPKRRSPSPKRRTFSPKHRPLSPKIRSFSPKRTASSPKRRSSSPRRRDRKDITENVPKNKLSIRDRLGFKSATKPEERDSKEKLQSDLSPRKDDKPLDPVLEARKKKFEVGEIKIREGVIRLKPKDEVKPEHVETQKPKAQMDIEAAAAPAETVVEKALKIQDVREEDILREEALLEDDELDLEAQVDFFSDEDSGSENEGRFKAKQQIGEKATVLPVSELMNGAKQEVKNGQLSENKGKRTRTPRDKNNDQKSASNTSSENTSSSRSKVRVSRSDKSLSPRKKLGVKAERHPKKFERKIEIKIKNPSKYERLDKADGDKDCKADKERGTRKVELGIVNKHEGDEDDDETEILVENDEDEVENAVSNEGDLRAQLSKKRAEKLQKTTSREEITSRLLQNALQNALPIKKSKKSKSKELSSSDGKVPIHLRLGLACSSDVFSKPKRKSKKRKNIETEDQV